MDKAAWKMKWAEWIEGWQEDFDSNAKGAEARARESWAAWCDKAFEKGAKGMRRLTRLRDEEEKWKPVTTMTTREEEGGKVTTETGAVLDKELNKLDAYWRSTEQPQAAWVPDRESFEEATPEQLKEAANKFAVGTGVSADGTHPRHFGMLSQGGLQTLSLIIVAMESIGMLPKPLRFLLMPLLSKPAGGYRPILMQAGLMRLWEKLRINKLEEFMEETARPYWVIAKGRSCEDVIWGQAVASERGVARGA